MQPLTSDTAQSRSLKDQTHRKLFDQPRIARTWRNKATKMPVAVQVIVSNIHSRPNKDIAEPKRKNDIENHRISTRSLLLPSSTCIYLADLPIPHSLPIYRISRERQNVSRNSATE